MMDTLLDLVRWLGGALVRRLGPAGPPPPALASAFAGVARCLADVPIEPDPDRRRAAADEVAEHLAFRIDNGARMVENSERDRGSTRGGEWKMEKRRQAVVRDRLWHATSRAALRVLRAERGRLDGAPRDYRVRVVARFEREVGGIVGDRLDDLWDDRAEQVIEHAVELLALLLAPTAPKTEPSER